MFHDDDEEETMDRANNEYWSCSKVPSGYIFTQSSKSYNYYISVLPGRNLFLETTALHAFRYTSKAETNQVIVSRKVWEWLFLVVKHATTFSYGNTKCLRGHRRTPNASRAGPEDMQDVKSQRCYRCWRRVYACQTTCLMHWMTGLELIDSSTLGRMQSKGHPSMSRRERAQWNKGYLRTITPYQSHAHQSSDFMKRLRVSSKPCNYSIWLSYYTYMSTIFPVPCCWNIVLHSRESN